MKNDATGAYERDPVSSADLDQQGWYVYTYSVPVVAADPGSSAADGSGSDEPVPDTPESDDHAPDLVIGYISWEPATPYEKDNMTFEVTAANKGPEPSGTFSVKCYIEGDEVSSNSVSGLEAGSNTSFTFDWVPSSSGDLNIKAVADADTQVLESDEGNNEKVESFTVKSSSTSSSSSSSRSSSGGGGGGGGGAGSPEPANNVEVKELSQEFITNGNHVKFEFPRNVTCITYAEFDPKRSLGKVTTIVEMLKGQSKIVPVPPSGIVYRYANVWVGNEGTASPKNIENAVVGFRVDKDWIVSKGVDESEIVLSRYSEEKWGELSTRKVGEDDRYVCFEAETPGFSPFAIVNPSAEGTDATSEDLNAAPAEGPDMEGSEEYVKSPASPGAADQEEVAETGGMLEDMSIDAGNLSSDAKAGIKPLFLVSMLLLFLLVLIGYMVIRKQG